MRAQQPLPVGPITITMPIPPSCLNPNTKSHWGSKIAARSQQRSDASTYAGATFRGPGPKWDRAKLTVRWFAKDDHRIPDIDNCIASIKGMIDGIADAGVLANDRGIEGIDVWRVVDKTRPRVELTVEKIVGPK